jgi:lysophospholipase L1-like esterase
MTKRVMNDLLHPNETGYRIWLDAIEPEFRRLLGK